MKPLIAPPSGLLPPSSLNLQTKTSERAIGDNGAGHVFQNSLAVAFSGPRSGRRFSPCFGTKVRSELSECWSLVFRMFGTAPSALAATRPRGQTGRGTSLLLLCVCVYTSVWLEMGGAGDFETMVYD